MFEKLCIWNQTLSYLTNYIEIVNRVTTTKPSSPEVCPIKVNYFVDVTTCDMRQGVFVTACFSLALLFLCNHVVNATLYSA